MGYMHCLSSMWSMRPVHLLHVACLLAYVPGEGMHGNTPSMLMGSKPKPNPVQTTRSTRTQHVCTCLTLMCGTQGCGR